MGGGGFAEMYGVWSEEFSPSTPTLQPPRSGFYGLEGPSAGGLSDPRCGTKVSRGRLLKTKVAKVVVATFNVSLGLQRRLLPFP